MGFTGYQRTCVGNLSNIVNGKESDKNVFCPKKIMPYLVETAPVYRVLTFPFETLFPIIQANGETTLAST